MHVFLFSEPQRYCWLANERPTILYRVEIFTMDFVSAVGLAVTLGVAHIGQADTTAVGAPEVTGAVARSVAWNIGKRIVEKRRASRN